MSCNPGGTGWLRVIEVNIPLYTDLAGQFRLKATGLRLKVRESGIISERVVPTVGIYRVGDYVNSHFDAGPPEGSSAVKSIGPAWMSDASGESRRKLWEISALFDGQPYAPEHKPRLMKLTLEPPSLMLRPEEKSPIVILGHYTDGVATWTEPLPECGISSENEKVAHVEQRTVFAKGYGRASLRLTSNGLYASASVHVAAHPTGIATDVLTGLPPVTGIAWADDALIVSTRTEELWRVGTDGRYKLATAVPLQPPFYGGIDTIAAAENGDLAIRLLSHPNVLVLDAASGYRRSRWVSPDENGTIVALAWAGEDLILALSTGSIWRAHGGGRSEKVATLPNLITSVDCCEDVLLALTAGNFPKLWRVPLSPDSEVAVMPIDQERPAINVVAWLNGSVYFTDFYGGRVLRLVDKELVEVATGLGVPGELAAGPDGSIYVAEFGRGAVRRLLP